MANNFVVRLRCPYGDEDQLLVLQDRQEKLSQILDTHWEFECSVHGVQREMPVDACENQMSSGSKSQWNESAQIDEAPKTRSSNRISTALEPPRSESTQSNEGPKPRSSSRMSLHLPVLVYGWSKGEASFHEETTTLLVNASGGLVTLESKVGLGDTVFVVNGTTQQEQECRVAYVGTEFQGKIRVGVAFKRQVPNFWRNNRKELRIPKSLRALVRGMDRNGQKFVQSALTIDVSQQGARLDGIGYLTGRGEIVEVSRRWRKARFRVVWVGEIGRAQAGQVGLFCLEPDKNIWRIQ